jgi:hypothetical protein
MSSDPSAGIEHLLEIGRSRQRGCSELKRAFARWLLERLEKRTKPPPCNGCEKARECADGLACFDFLHYVDPRFSAVGRNPSEAVYVRIFDEAG